MHLNDTALHWQIVDTVEIRTSSKSYINYPLGRACLLPGCDPAQQLASAMWASGPEMKFDRLIGGWIDEGRQAVLAVRGSARIGQTIRSGLVWAVVFAHSHDMTAPPTNWRS